MKVVNIALNGLYTDGYSYHENLLPKYHKKNGHEVYTIASEYEFSTKGECVKYTGPNEYVNDEGVNIIRLPIKNNKHISYKFKRFVGLYETLDRIKPDVIFCHLFQFIDVKEVIRYKKDNPNVRLFLDSHADFSNSATTWISRNILHKLIWRHYAQLALPYFEKIYGVLPARCDFIHKMYKIPKDKIELLVMAADDELCLEVANSKYEIRKKYGINKDDFVIVTGGKIDIPKRQTLLLMEAVNLIKNDKIKLIVFGPVISELEEQVKSLCSEKVKYIGWISSKDSYSVFQMADLVVFPGRHSVFWEQVVGQGIPMIVKHWEGTTHVDCGGNVEFLYNDSVDEIKKKIEKVSSPKYYEKMKKNAEESKEKFLYSKIAERSIRN